MKKRTFLIGLGAGVFSSTPTYVFGITYGTEITQIANNGVITAQLALQVKEYSLQIQQHIAQVDMLKTMATNLISNPISLLGPEIGNIISGVGKIMSAGKSIGSTMAQISENFKNTFKVDFAGDYHDKFRKWHETSSDTLEGMMKASALHRERFETETDKLKALYTETQKTKGNLEALQTLSKVAIDQSQKLQQLGDLVASANLATGTYMARKTSRKQVKNYNMEKMTKKYDPAIKKEGTEENINWSNVLLSK